MPQPGSPPPAAASSVGLLDVWRFPLREPARRRDMLLGGILFVCVPLLGWILNLGHRWRVMERLFHDSPPWFRGFRPLWGTFLRGLGVATLGLAYLVPGVALLLVGLDRSVLPLQVAGLAWAVPAFYAFPVAIGRFAQTVDPSWYLTPHRAFALALGYGMPYLRMWGITWVTIAVSVVPLFVAVAADRVGASDWWWAAVVPFGMLSPWAWSALGYGFGSILVPRTVAQERRESAPDRTLEHAT